MSIVDLLGAAGLIEGNHQGGVISAILFLIPGFPMVTAMLDLVRQDFSSALSRAAYVLMVMASAGVAVWTVTFLFNWQVEATDVSVPTGWVLHVLRCLCSFVAAYGFSMLFNAGAKASTLAAVVGALANTGRLILIDEFHVPWQLAVGLAAVIIGVLAQLFVTRASLSRVALSVPAVVIMIPGVPFYRAISALNDRAVDANVAVGQAAANLAKATRARAIWLLINLFTALISSSIIGLFDETIASYVVLAVLMPIVASMGGNTGTQALTIGVPDGGSPQRTAAGR